MTASNFTTYGPTCKKIIEAINKDDLEKLRHLLSENKIDKKEVILLKSQDSALHIAVRTGKYHLVKWLLDNGFLVHLEHQNKDGKRPLHEAAQLGYLEILDLLLCKNAIVDPLKRADWTPLMLASAKDDLSIIQRLVTAGASLELSNKDGWTPFHIACRGTNTKIVNYFLNVEEVWNCRSKNGRTPLHTAALHGNTEVVYILLKRGHYPPDETDSCGNTPLMDAVRSGHMDCVRLLLGCKDVSVNKSDSMGRKVIHLGAEAGQVNVVKVLIEEYDVDVNSVTQNGQTLLHFAAKEGHLPMIELLLSLNANINAKDPKMRTALWVAGAARKHAIYQLLLCKGAEVDGINAYKINEE